MQKILLFYFLCMSINIIELGNKLLRSTSSFSLRRELRSDKYKCAITIRKEDIYSVRRINKYILEINEGVYVSEIFGAHDFSGDLKFNRKYDNILFSVENKI